MITTKTVNFRLVKGIQARLTGASAHAIRGDENYFCHRHSYYELHVVEKGSCVFSINDHAYRVGAGNFCLIVPETYHYLLSTSEDCRKLCLGVELTREHEDAAGEPSLLDALDESRVVIHASAAVCRWAEELFSLMRADRSDVISQELLRAQLALLLLNVLAEIVPRPGRQERTRRASSEAAAPPSTTTSTAIFTSTAAGHSWRRSWASANGSSTASSSRSTARAIRRRSGRSGWRCH